MDDTTRRLLLAVGVFLVVALALSALTGGMMAGHMFGPSVASEGGWMWGLGMGFGGLVMLLFWGALLIGVVLAVRHAGGADQPPREAAPLDVAKRRYAAGDITREQFEQIRRDLQGN